MLLPLLTLIITSCGGGGDAPAAQASSKQAPAAQPAQVQREGILFAITPHQALTPGEEDGFGLDPIALITRGGLRNTWDVESDSVFAARYFAPGTRYDVRVGGAEAGEASVRGVIEPACQERVAGADVRLSRTLPAGWEGLASDAFGAGAAQPVVRPLTSQEQGWLAALADSIHASHRIPGAARAAVEGERLFAVTVPGVQGPVLVGTFNVTVEDGENQHLYNQLLVAEARGGGAYQPAYVFHERDDGDVGVRSFMDAADLDGDGAPELVLRAAYNDSWGYAVLKRGAEGWTEIYQGGGGGGC
ncbi:MAG TPA: hypothetical protein VHG08_27875 [Longimicrobium sp.]|nr:hypothetical protein [Longimicrobium sp.]